MRMLIVCQGNFVKSPAIEAVLRHRMPGLEIESAGIRPQFENRYCYVPMIEDLTQAGYSLEGKISTRFKPAHFARADVIFAVEMQTFIEVSAMRPAGDTTPVTLFSADRLPDLFATNDPVGFRHAVENMVDGFVAGLTQADAA